MHLLRHVGFCLITVLLATSELAAQAAQAVPPQAIDSSWLQANAGTKTVTLKLVAGLTPLNGALNFNGFRDGGLTVTVPAGWTMIWDFSNHDGMLPHSAEVVENKLPVPASSVKSAITMAYTDQLDQGIPPQGSDKDRFTATPAGEYLIICGVPGHARAGMWIRLNVSSSANAPEMALTQVE